MQIKTDIIRIQKTMRYLNSDILKFKTRQLLLFLLVSGLKTKPVPQVRVLVYAGMAVTTKVWNLSRELSIPFLAMLGRLAVPQLLRCIFTQCLRTGLYSGIS